MRMCTTFLLALLLGFSTGCHVNRARAAKEPKAEMTTPVEDIQITGSYSIAEDGTVTYNITHRPDGHLLSRSSTEGIELEFTDSWIRSTASRAGGSIARITSITGPYRDDPDDLEDPLLYDLTIEVWAGR